MAHPDDRSAHENRQPVGNGPDPQREGRPGPAASPSARPGEAAQPGEARPAEGSRPGEASPTRGEPRTPGDRPAGRMEAREDSHIARDSFIGTDQASRSVNNSSWGAIFAGTVTFLALMLVFGLISAALGLTEAGGVAVGIWSIVALLLALAAAGYVAGALAVRGGLLHGLVTWATSLVSIVLLVGWLGAGILGAAGGALGNVAQTAVEETDVTATEVEQQLDVDQEELDQAQQEAEQAAQEAQDVAAETAWWTVAGLVLGAAVAAFAGVAGARTVHTRDAELHATARGRR